jgi:hypothetical protein
MSAQRTASRPRVGDEAWVVEWCTKIGMVDEDHPEYGCDPDNSETTEQIVPTKADAERLAKEVYRLDKYGSVPYWPIRFMAYDEDDVHRYPYVGYWDATDDAEYYEGEDNDQS